jgi:transposase
MNVKRIGVDLAKNVFELYGVDESEQRALSKTVRRGQLLATFAQLPPCLVGMEACGSAHYWGREFRKPGHEPRRSARRSAGRACALSRSKRLSGRPC